MNIQIRELDHVVLRVSDVARALHFYCEVLGCTEERRADKIGLIQLRAGSSLIDLVDVNGELGRKGGPAPGPDGYNMDHFCVRVDQTRPSTRLMISGRLANRNRSWKGEVGSKGVKSAGQGFDQRVHGHHRVLPAVGVNRGEGTAQPQSPHQDPLTAALHPTVQRTI